MVRDATLHLDVTGLPAFKDAVEAIVALHKPRVEEVEAWADDEDPTEHDRRFPECPAIGAEAKDACEGHTFTMQVCGECGYADNGDFIVYRPWPCATLLALTPLGVGVSDG